jgi:hypothetical protein
LRVETRFDSQTVKTTDVGSTEWGYDAGKKRLANPAEN